jgi:hypothetical protein
VSWVKVYSGCPLKVSWVEPSDRLIVAYGLLTVVGAVCGGQAVAHAPLQADLVAVSEANE